MNDQKTKVLEIRDNATCIPALAIRMDNDYYNVREARLLNRVGYDPGQQLVILVFLIKEECTYDPNKWGGRTMPVAHAYITQYWYLLQPGDVVDVRWILGETEAPAISDVIYKHDTEPYKKLIQE